MNTKKTVSTKKDTYYVPDFNCHVQATSAKEAGEIAAKQANKKEQPVVKKPELEE